MTQPQAAPSRAHVHVAADGMQSQLVDPLMPELEPGRTITTTPERWCPQCGQARGGTVCAVCGGRCRVRGETDPVQAPQLPPDGEMDDAPVLELDAAPGSETQLEPAEVDRLLDEVRVPRQLRRAAPAPFKPSAGLERMRARAAELNAPPPEPPIVQRAAGRSLVSAAIAEQHVNRPWEPLTGPRREPPYRRRTPMPPQPQRTYDERGREVQTMGGGPRRGQLTAEDQLVQFWGNAKVDLSVWSQFASAFAAHPGVVNSETGLPDPQLAADLADQLYVELIQRQGLAGQR